MERSILIETIGMVMGAFIMTIWMGLDMKEHLAKNPDITLATYLETK